MNILRLKRNQSIKYCIQKRATEAILPQKVAFMG
jgi:hypothetical protein